MAKQTHEGICRLCGKQKNLTFEHVPPEKAFNNVKVTRLSPDESLPFLTGANGRKPWDTSGLKGAQQQRGMGDYYLCSECNNNTGSWYMSEYTKFANVMNEFIQTHKPLHKASYILELENIHPLRLFKAIMVMFCDLNHDCFKDEELRNFLLNKESNRFNHQKYSVYMYLANSDQKRIWKLAWLHRNDCGGFLISEIASYPLGVLLYINKPASYRPQALCLNELANCCFNDSCKITLTLPCYEICSQFPEDYRSKKEFDSNA